MMIIMTIIVNYSYLSHTYFVLSTVLDALHFRLLIHSFIHLLTQQILAEYLY